MKKALFLSALVLQVSILFAQSSVERVLTEIEKNNTTLVASRKNADAEKTGNKTGILPSNPEAEYGYLYGSPSAIGNRTDFSITQSVDFPTAYAYKGQISALRNDQAELEYLKQHSEIIHQARLVCVQLTYHNALNAELHKRLANAKKVADAYTARYHNGDVSILDYNKAMVSFLSITKQLQANEIERNALLSELTLLNGGIGIAFSDSTFASPEIPADFEKWYATIEVKNPLLQWIKQETAVSEKQIKLQKAMSLPKLAGGYMSENVVGEDYRGVTVGITIPLWENKNTVKYARAKNIALKSIETDARLQFYNRLKATHLKTVSLQNNVTDFRNQLALFSNTALLEKAFSTGEISLTEYMYELSVFYDSMDTMLSMELALHTSLADLQKVAQ